MDYKQPADVKAALGEGDDLEAFFAGRRPARILSLPFGGPIPSKASARGVDLDGEYFHEGTDPFVHRALRQDRERPVDWHHSARPPGPGFGDPTGRMSGVILGKSVLDEEPDEEGWWSQLWLDAGERRIALVARLRERGAQIFGSSQPVPGSVSKAGARIDAWAHMMQTLSTSPQNTLSRLEAKALLGELPEWLPVAGVRAVLSALNDLNDHAATGDASGAAKAGRELSSANEREIEEALEAIAASYEVAGPKLRQLLERVRSKYHKED